MMFIGLSLRMLFFFFFQAEDGIRYKLVTGVQTCALPISSAVFEKCRSPADVGPVDEDSLPISAEEPLGRRCPSHVSDLDQIAEDAGRHPSLSQRSTQVNGSWFQMHRSATAGMLLKAISQLLRLRLFVFRLPDKTSAGLVHPIQQGSIDRKKP